MRNKFVQFCLFMLLLVGLFSGCAAQVKGPGIQFGSERYDFGTVDEGKIVNHAFEFTNNGTETLIISGVLSTCTCTYVRDFDKVVQPGKSGKISVSLNTKGLDGKVTKNVILGTNIPERENIPLTIEGTVKASPSAASTIKVGGAGSGVAFWRIQTGETVIGSSASASKEIKVAFAEAFSGTPKIVATVRNDPGWDGGDTFAVTVRRISNTQFVANIVRVDKALPWNQNPLLEWMAWE
jgi:hypothetical protein